jgi:hypothetical protein
MSLNFTVKRKVQDLCTGLDRPLELQEIEASRISTQSVHQTGEVVSPTHRSHLPPRNLAGTHFCKRLSRPQGHNRSGRVQSIKNSNYCIGV